jgi:hypothetical protein
MNNEWTPWLTGGAAGALMTFVINGLIGRWRRFWLWWDMLIYDPTEHNFTVTVRVKNGYVLPLTNCWGYISLNINEAADILQPPTGNAHINPTAPFRLRKDRLCWSVAGCPGHVDVCPREAQSLQVFQVFSQTVYPGGKLGIGIGIFSESRDNPYRVFLRGDKKYEGYLEVVCKETFEKKVGIRINPMAKPGSRLEIVPAKEIAEW